MRARGLRSRVQKPLQSQEHSDADPVLVSVIKSQAAICRRDSPNSMDHVCILIHYLTVNVFSNVLKETSAVTAR